MQSSRGDNPKNTDVNTGCDMNKNVCTCSPRKVYNIPECNRHPSNTGEGVMKIFKKL